MKISSSKKNARILAGLLYSHGCRDVVISPGSRNAPLIHAFAADGRYNMHTQPDERAAAFTALGMTLAENRPVALLCTSGSAVANYYPAVAEAYYQLAPLLVISADRPKELIDQGIGQTMQQEHIFGKHVQYSVSLLRDTDTGDQLLYQYNQREINRALRASANGPVHINAPFGEPLYERVEVEEEERYGAVINQQINKDLSRDNWRKLAAQWQGHSKIWVIAAMRRPEPELMQAMETLRQKSPFAVFTETTANLPLNGALPCIDRFVNTLTKEEKQQFKPDLVITIGGEIISKMVKAYLGNGEDYVTATAHWQIADGHDMMDAFDLLKHYLDVDATTFFRRMAEYTEPRSSDFPAKLQKAEEYKRAQHQQFLAECEFSDLKAFDLIIKNLEPGTILHCGNSASIRYSQLFDHHKEGYHHTNRGTSGIDGCTSTAIGHAMQTDEPVVLITGEIAFNYDSNAFWNDKLPANFRCIVLNNGGGNIFRIIAGPEKDADFERYQETVHKLNLDGVARIYGIEHQRVASEKELSEALPGFLNVKQGNAPQILEIVTPREKNPEILLQYFRYIKRGTTK